VIKNLFAVCVSLLFIASIVFADDNAQPKKDTTELKAKTDTTEIKKMEPETITTKSGLKYIDHVVGDGEEAVKGMTVEVHYTGWLNDDGKRGKKFDSSKDRDQPFSFLLGGGRVIRGWDEGVVGMKVGGTRELIIPSDLGYGSRGAGNVIPPNATLIFEVELLGVSKK